MSREYIVVRSSLRGSSAWSLEKRDWGQNEDESLG